MKFSLIQVALFSTSVVNHVNAFTPTPTSFSVKNTSTSTGTSTGTPSSTKMSMTNDDRRSFFHKIVGSAAIAGVTLLQTPFPANAIGGGLKKVNAKLAG